MRFTEILDRKAEDFERPPLLPLGHYILSVSKHPEIDDFTSRDGVIYDRVTFQCQVIEACDDVDPDELQEYGNCAGVPLRHNFMMSTAEEDSNRAAQTMFSLRQFLEQLGLDLSNNMGELLAASVGQVFRAEIGYRADKNDAEIQYQEIKRTSSAA